jgi:predicted amidophosphoribosyltransferase
MDQMLTSELLDCDHPVCRGCLKNLRDTRCPLCRREIGLNFINESAREKIRQRFELDRIQEKMEEEQEEIELIY